MIYRSILKLDSPNIEGMSAILGIAAVSAHKSRHGVTMIESVVTDILASDQIISTNLDNIASPSLRSTRQDGILVCHLFVGLSASVC